MRTSEESQLPTFEVTRFNIMEPKGSYTMLEVVCPRLHCKMEFWVKASWGIIYAVEGASDKPPAHPTGRPCPHCSKASHIPPEFRIKGYADRTRENKLVAKPKPKGRVVRRKKAR